MRMVIMICQEITYAELGFACYAEARPENGFIKKPYIQQLGNNRGTTIEQKVQRKNLCLLQFERIKFTRSRVCSRVFPCIR